MQSQTRIVTTRAFTLVEVMLVIILLSIVSLVAIPLVGDVSTSSGEATARGNVATLRSAIELFYNQHNGLYPSAVTDGANALGSEAAFITHLTQYSNAAGVVSATKSSSYPYGPYLRLGVPKITVGPLNGNSNVSVTNAATALTADGSPTQGWKYSYVTGQIICNTTATSADGTLFSSF